MTITTNTKGIDVFTKDHVISDQPMENVPLSLSRLSNLAKGPQSSVQLIHRVIIHLNKGRSPRRIAIDSIQSILNFRSRLRQIAKSHYANRDFGCCF